VLGGNSEVDATVDAVLGDELDLKAKELKEDDELCERGNNEEDNPVDTELDERENGEVDAAVDGELDDKENGKDDAVEAELDGANGEMKGVVFVGELDGRLEGKDEVGEDESEVDVEVVFDGLDIALDIVFESELVLENKVDVVFAVEVKEEVAAVEEVELGEAKSEEGTVAVSTRSTEIQLGTEAAVEAAVVLLLLLGLLMLTFNLGGGALNKEASEEACDGITSVAAIKVVGLFLDLLSILYELSFCSKPPPLLLTPPPPFDLTESMRRVVYSSSASRSLK